MSQTSNVKMIPTALSRAAHSIPDPDEDLDFTETPDDPEDFEGEPTEPDDIDFTDTGPDDPD